MLIESPSGLSVASSTPSGWAEPLLYWVAFGAAVSILFSIAISQILLGLGIALLVSTRQRLRFPPILLPLSLFFLWTIGADLLSGDPAKGFPQIRKFFVFGIVLLIFSSFRGIRAIHNLILAWAGAATLSALFALFQFFTRWREATDLHAQKYDYVLDGRIKGFSSHWMTFGGEEMITLLMLLSLLLFSTSLSANWRRLGWACAGLLWITLVLGFTRSIFLLGVPVGVLILAWSYRRWLTLAMPAVGILMFLVAPMHVRERVLSVVHPHGNVDSNSRRSIMFRTGIRMIEAHPWFGVGPEQIQPQFLAYLPKDVPTPLPIGWYGHLHNVYLQYGAERGIPGLFFVLWFIAKMVADFYQALEDRSTGPPFEEARFVYYGALAVIGAVLAQGFFEYNLGDSEVLTMFLVVATCGYVAIESKSIDRTPTHEELDANLQKPARLGEAFLSSKIRRGQPQPRRTQCG
jgi:putative inorganic carbon (hco3(-)) transporter